MNKSKLNVAITIVTMLLCLTAVAQRPQGRQGGRSGQGPQSGGKPDASMIFSMLDTNNDKKIDIDEASKDTRGKIAQDFNSIDTNDDQFIDFDELQEALTNGNSNRNMAERMLKEVDDNHDGTLNNLEIAAKEKLELTNNFKEIDVNQDNELDLQELKAFYAKKEKPKRKKRK